MIKNNLMRMFVYCFLSICCASSVLGDSTSTAKLYSNQQYGFKFQYPSYFHEANDSPYTFQAKSDKSDQLTVIIHDRPLDGHVIRPIGDTVAFEYSADIQEWKSKNHPGLKSSIEKYIKNSLLAFIDRDGDGGKFFTSAYIEAPDKSFFVIITLSTNEFKGFYNDIYSDNRLIISILDSFHFDLKKK